MKFVMDEFIPNLKYECVYKMKRLKKKLKDVVTRRGNKRDFTLGMFSISFG